ncbi:MAG: DHH family phosphoesterase [Clostridia bacterium]|nr:DHH family phosphoesterase [Clostridia bacterium]
MKNEKTAAKVFFNTRRRYIRLGVYAVLLVALGIVMAINRRPEAILELALSAGVVAFEIFHVQKSQKEFLRYTEHLDFCLNDNSRGSLLNYPAPLVITDMSGKINWYNDWFRSVIGEADLFGRDVVELLPELQISAFVETNEHTRVNLTIGDNYYEIWGNVAKNATLTNRDSLVVLYFIEKTEEVRMAKLREDEQLIETIVIIDNYDEVLKETPDTNHGALLGEIESKIGSWVALGNGIMRKYERDKYIVLFNNKEFEKIMENKFAVLEEVRSINHENKIPATLSIGVGRSGVDVAENDKYARLAIDMALGRGGDQVVIRDSANFTFFGAKTREVEKRTKVRARVMAHALRELVDNSSKVLIMGHSNSDMDSLGASIGLFKAVKSRDKDAFIVIEQSQSNAKMMLQEFKTIPQYEDAFISGEHALNIFEKETLVIVVDVHRPGMVECPELLQHAENVVLIDHHRKSEDFIENPVLTYHEPFASSTCEMITEILQYIQENERLTKQEAEALYAGIFMDTKGFTFKAGVRTFEAASYLRRMGVDTVNVRKFFKTNIDSYIAKAEIIRTAVVFKDNIALSYLYEECPDMAVTVAQAADELLNISGIEASFVLAAAGNRVLISGRSLESVNVQVILEKLGGGGHITIAGAQLEDTGIEQADIMLREAIEEVLSQ